MSSTKLVLATSKVCLVFFCSLAWNRITTTVEPPETGQHGDEPFALSREIVLLQRFTK